MTVDYTTTAETFTDSNSEDPDKEVDDSETISQGQDVNTSEPTCFRSSNDSKPCVDYTSDDAETFSDPYDENFVPNSENETGEDIPLPFCQNGSPRIQAICLTRIELDQNTSENTGPLRGPYYQHSVPQCDFVQNELVTKEADKSSSFQNRYICDTYNQQIFTKKYLKNTYTDSVSGRNYDRRHACYFCKKLMTNIQTHYEHSHKNTEEVQSLIKMKLEIENIASEVDRNVLKKRLHTEQSLLRNKGNHIHNTEVCHAKRGEILLTRRKETNTFDISEYGPCPKCEEWIVLNNLSKHRKNCIKKGGTEAKGSEVNESVDNFTKGSAIVQSKIMKGYITLSASKKLLNEVFPSMNRDRITQTAQNDSLTVSLGDVWQMKHFGNKLRRKHFTSFRMRLASRLLLCVREAIGDDEASMHTILKPTYFDKVVECSLKACQEYRK